VGSPRSRLRPAGIAGAVAGIGALCACGDAPQRAGRSVHPEQPAHDRRFVAEPVARAAISLSGRAAVQTAGGLAVVDGEALRGLDGLDGDLVGVADSASGLLVVTTAGAFVQADGAWAPVRLIDRDALGAPVAVVEGPGAVWVVAERGLARVEGSAVGSMRPVPPWSAPPRSAAAGPDGRTLWVVVDGRLHRARDAEGTLSWTRFGSREAAGVGVGRDGAPVRGTPDGAQVLLRGAWQAAPAAVGQPEAIRGHPQATVWVQGSAGWLHWDGAWTPVTGIPGDARLLGVTAEGGAVVATARTTRVVHAGPAVGLSGLPADVLDAPTSVRAWVTRPETVDALALTVDGDRLAPDEDGTWTLDPDAFGFVEIRLRVEARSGDEIYASADYALRSVPVEPPTWSDDIRPLFEAKCALCHGAGASARPLDARDDWIAAIDEIVANVSSGRMPLPPVELLDGREVALVRTWRDAEFPE